MELHTCVAHSASWWSGDTSDEADNWLSSQVVVSQEICGLLLCRSTDLTNHDDTIGLLILQEDSQAVDEVGSREWITTNTNDQRLTKTSLSGLIYSLVCESS